MWGRVGPGKHTDKRGNEGGTTGGGAAGVAGKRARTPESSDEEWEVEGDGSGSGEGVNGEAVREGMERWRAQMVGRTAVWGVGWAVTVVGLWGDGV